MPCPAPAVKCIRLHERGSTPTPKAGKASAQATNRHGMLATHPPLATTMRLMPRIALLALLTLLSVSASAAENKWRMQFSGNAESDGALEVTITPNGDNPPVVVSIPVTAGTSENGVAKAVRDGLRAGLPKGYKVERDDGEDVLVKRRLGTARFTLEVTGNTVNGVRVNLDQE